MVMMRTSGPTRCRSHARFSRNADRSTSAQQRKDMGDYLIQQSTCEQFARFGVPQSLPTKTRQEGNFQVERVQERVHKCRLPPSASPTPERPESSATALLSRAVGQV